MARSYKFRLLVACVVAVTAAISIWAVHAGRGPISAAFVRYRTSNGGCEAVVTLRNQTGLPIRCEGLIACSRRDRDQGLEFAHSVKLELAGKQTTEVTVSVPFGPGPAHVSCTLKILAHHSAAVRWAGGLLEGLGIYVYHTNSPLSVVSDRSLLADRLGLSYPSATLTNLTVSTRGGNLRGSLGDWVRFPDYTNSWNTP